MSQPSSVNQQAQQDQVTEEKPSLPVLGHAAVESDRSSKLDLIIERLDGMLSRFDRVDDKLSKIGVSLGEADAGVKAILSDLKTTDAPLEKPDNSLDRVEAALAELKDAVRKNGEAIEEVRDALSSRSEGTKSPANKLNRLQDEVFEPFQSPSQDFLRVSRSFGSGRDVLGRWVLIVQGAPDERVVLPQRLRPSSAGRVTDRYGRKVKVGYTG